MLHNRAIALLMSLAFLGLCACVPNAHLQKKAEPHKEQNILGEGAPENLIIYQGVNDKCTNAGDGKVYRIGSKDTLLITVFGEKDLSGEYTIDDTGVISFPLIGEVLLSGCSVREAEGMLKELYMDGYFVNPSVSIEISKFRPFYILGEVKSPGQYDFVVDTNILQATAIAGGFTYRANKKTTKVLRRNANGEPYYSNQALESKVRPGDVIIVKERFF